MQLYTLRLTLASWRALQPLAQKASLRLLDWDSGWPSLAHVHGTKAAGLSPDHPSRKRLIKPCADAAGSRHSSSALCLPPDCVVSPADSCIPV